MKRMIPPLLLILASLLEISTTVILMSRGWDDANMYYYLAIFPAVHLGMTISIAACYYILFLRVKKCPQIAKKIIYWGVISLFYWDLYLGLSNLARLL